MTKLQSQQPLAPALWLMQEVPAMMNADLFSRT